MIKYLYMKFAGNMHMTLKLLVVAALFMHIGYLIIFALMGAEKLVVTNIFSVITYILLVVIVFEDSQNLKIAMAIFQFEVLFHAVICMLVLGYGFGFELLFFAMLVNLLLIANSHSKLTYFMLMATVSMFIVLFWLLFDNRVDTGFWSHFLFTYNFVLVAVVFVLMTDLLEVSNSFELLNVKKQRSILKDMANKDPLTGLLNRKSLDIFVQDYLHNDVNFAVIIGDIDNFKMINDTYGHNAGDDALVRIASVFKSVFRHNDFVCRWGGEEFLIIIYDVEPNIAFETMNRAKSLITQTPLNFENKKIELTLTYGMVTHIKGSDINIEQMIKKADDLLYKGKKSGKNRIVTS
ncbi:GGDEF domain-containing protein [Campylobacter sp. 9BO]|uniref:GGDEF domain-containing protein n=1 Tax=Campylobacter sp. 9BO TaxID=3424759 RepID=UPI003D350420